MWLDEFFRILSSVMSYGFSIKILIFESILFRWVMNCLPINILMKWNYFETFNFILWSVRGSCQTIWGPPLPNVTRHSGWWPYTVTPSIDHTLNQFLTVTDLDLVAEFDFLPDWARFPWNICNACGMPTEDAYSGHLVLYHFGTCILCSNVKTNLSWTCLVSGLLSFKHPSVLLFCFLPGGIFPS